MKSARLIPLAVVVTLGLSACLVHKSVRDYRKAQRDALVRSMPGKLEVTKPVTGDPRVAKVRIWVDDDFRAQNVRWRAHIEEQVDEANQFLVPALGLRLEITEMKPWAVRQADRTLAQVIEALEQLDDGKDVTWVLAYTSSLSLVEASFEQLGVARPLGRHMVVRGYADIEERKLFERNLPDTSEGDREVVHQARRRHKQALVLIHELGHTLGAMHEVDPSWIMHDAYSVAMTQLSDRSRELMQISLEAWLTAPTRPDERTLAARLVTYLESNPWGGWNEAELREWVAHLHAIGATAGGPDGGGGGGAGGPDVPVPPAAFEQFRRAQQLARQGKLDDALAELEALVTAYPASAEIRQGICEVQVGKVGPGGAAAVAACDRAAELSPDDVRPYLVRIQGHLTKGDPRAAIALMTQVEQRAGERAEAWDQVATIYQGLNLVTSAERAGARAAQLGKRTEPHPVVAWAGRTRARYGLPPDARRWKIAVADEGEYVLAVRELLDLIYASKTSEAVTKATAAEKRWKAAPGILAARCDLHLRQGELAKARTLCRQAIAGWPGAAWALYLGGVIAFQDGKPRDAVKSLQRAIAADPELAQAYRALGKALKVTNATAERDALAAEYQRRFGSALPP